MLVKKGSNGAMGELKERTRDFVPVVPAGSKFYRPRRRNRG